MEVTQSCLTLCNSMGCSPPGSSVHGDSPGKNTRVGRHSLLQGIVLTQGLNLGLLHFRWIFYHLSHQGREWLSLWQKRGEHKPSLQAEPLPSCSKPMLWETSGSNDPDLYNFQVILKNVKHLILKCCQWLQSFKNAPWAKQDTLVGWRSSSEQPPWDHCTWMSQGTF